MKTVFVSNATEMVTGPSIFLAGPSPRGNMDYNWRPQALKFLEHYAFNGTVFVPLQSDWQWLDNYQAQIDWELHYLDLATAILFWIPRHLEHLPGFTTNVEYGMFVKSGKIVLGHPKSAPKLGYLNRLAQLNHIPICHNLKATAITAIQLCEIINQENDYGLSSH